MSDQSLPFADELLAAELLNALPVPAALHRDGLLLAANPALQRLCGLSLDELRQRNGASLLSEDQHQTLRQAGQDCLRQPGEPPALYGTLLTRDGSPRQVEVTQRRVMLGGLPTVLLTCVDHSDIHHVQSSLFSLSDMLRQIVDNGPVASYVIDMNHRVTHWNAACARLTGIPAAEMIGSVEPWRAFYAEKRPTLSSLIVSDTPEAELLASYSGDARVSALVPGSYEVESYFPRLGDHGRWLYFTAAPLRNQQGEITGAIETLQDITVRRETEEELMCHRSMLESLVEARSEALAASARELEAFIDNAPIGVAYISEHKVQRANRALERMFGLTHAEAIGRPSPEFMRSREEFDALIAEIRPTLAHGGASHSEGWLRHADGHPVWMQMNAFMPDPKDPAMGSWWMLQDRTEVQSAQNELRMQFEQQRETNRRLEEAQNQLLQSEKMASIGQLAAGVAHEINNPIGFVSSNLNTLRQYVDDLMRLIDTGKQVLDAPGDLSRVEHMRAVSEEIEIPYLREDLPQLLDESADGLNRVKKIVQDLKDFSRVDQSEWQEADLNAGLESTLNVVRNEVKYKADVVMRLGELPPVNCLAGQLNQVFMNLIVNASHAIQDRGVITLSSGTEGPWAWIEVGDSGCGMTEEVIRRIFEPFYTTKEVGKGTGLGLSLAFSIVQRHGGAIQVHSTPGEGSRFRVWVPIGGPATVSGPPPQWV